MLLGLLLIDGGGSQHGGDMLLRKAPCVVLLLRSQPFLPPDNARAGWRYACALCHQSMTVLMASGAYSRWRNTW